MTAKKRKLRFPSIAAVAAELVHVKTYLDHEVTDIDVRLQVYPDGQWKVRSGDSSFDQDHRGYWGAGCVMRSTNCRDEARRLIGEAAEHYAQCDSPAVETSESVW